PETPWAARASTAPSSSFLLTASLKRPATTANRPREPPPRGAGMGPMRGARPATSVRERGEEVAELVPLGREIAPVRLGGGHLEGHALDHVGAVHLEPDGRVG